MYKIIACDLDETLLKADKTVSQKNIETISKLKKMGIKFVPSTGRNFVSVDKTLKEIGLFDEENQFVISLNGGVITENKNHKILYCKGLPFELAEEFFKRGSTYDVCIHVYTIDKVYAYKMNHSENRYLKGRQVVEEFFENNIDFLKGQEIIKCLYVNEDKKYLDKIAEDLQDIIKNVDVSYSSSRYMEFNQKGISKGTGLQKLAKILNVDMKDTMAIGDNFNDLSMIKMAGLGVGVANVVEDMKPDCDYICQATHEEDAVTEAIDKFVFNA